MRQLIGVSETSVVEELVPMELMEDVQEEIEDEEEEELEIQLKDKDIETLCNAVLRGQLILPR